MLALQRAGAHRCCNISELQHIVGELAQIVKVCDGLGISDWNTG